MAEPAPLSPDSERMRAVWRQELIKLFLLCCLGALVGSLFSGAIWGFLVVLGVHVALHYRYLASLMAWLRHPKRYLLPEPGGLWGEVYDRLLDLQRRNRKKKKRLAGMLAEFQASTAALPDGAVVLSERGDIIRFNLAAQTLLGLRSQDVGLRVATLMRHPRFTEYLLLGDFSQEVEMPSPVNSSKILSARVIPYGKEQRLLILRVSNASHELRTPLTVLKGYLEMMEAEAQGGGALSVWKAPLGEMKNQSIRMESLVNDMLKLARLESDMQPRPVWIAAAGLIRQAVNEARALSAGQHSFEVEVDERLQVLGSELDLLSLFANLVVNAVRYTPPQGMIRVRWEAAAGGGADYSVADTGIGIAQEDIPRLTERFYRVDVGRSRASGGTGLGLSIVKHAVERHDARLLIDSEVGVGSTFTCLFPGHRIRPVEPLVAAAPEVLRRS
jgi:two-component system, OmpR family, phosphate regulon sensor histidine kinase PhoR